MISSPRSSYTNLLQAASGGSAASQEHLVKQPGTYSMTALLLRKTECLTFHALTPSSSGEVSRFRISLDSLLFGLLLDHFACFSFKVVQPFHVLLCDLWFERVPARYLLPLVNSRHCIISLGVRLHEELSDGLKRVSNVERRPPSSDEHIIADFTRFSFDVWVIDLRQESDLKIFTVRIAQ